MSKRKPASLDVDAVLAGRIKPTAAELLELIHRENPTGRALDARESELRYVRKARLQSLLVRSFASDLEVAIDAWQPGAISLRHRGHGRDGCHAILEALDDDARAWVQRELDFGAHSVDTTSTSSLPTNARGARRSRPTTDGDETPEALVRRAEASLAEYDYDVARATLEEALAISNGAVGPAAALLALLVDTLGDDAAALAIETSIASAALADPRVRAPLALAAARCGDQTRALGLARGLDDSNAARVLVAVALEALTRGEDERATAHLEDAKRRDPTCETIAGVAAAIAKHRAAAREPAEGELTALIAAGVDSAIEASATSLLARWPESQLARRALHELALRRRQADVARFLAEADAAIAQGDVAVGLTKLRQASASAGASERESIDRRIDALEGAERERRDSARVEETIRALAGDDPKPGLMTYATFDARLRSRVRTRSKQVELEWIDLMAGGRGAARAWVDAAMAISQARATLPMDPEATIALLAPHDTLIERVADARRIARDAEQALFARRLEAAKVAVAKARELLGVGAEHEALALLGGVSVRDLPNNERAEAERIEAAATRVVDRRQRATEVVAMREAGRWFEARALVEALAVDSDDASERARWEREAAELRRGIRRSFRVQIDDEPRAPDDLGRFRPHADVDDASWWLTPDGGRVAIARAFDRWVIVSILDLASMKLRPTITLRTPEPLRVVDTTVCGETLWLAGDRGAVVELSMVSWDVVAFRPSKDFVGATDIVEGATIVATDKPSSPRYLWLACRAHGASMPRPLRVIDLGQRRTVRELPDLWRATPLAGGEEQRVVAMKDFNATLYSPRGTLVPEGRLDVPFDVHALATHPSGDGFVALISAPSLEPLGSPEGPLKLGILSRTGHVDAIVELPDADPERASCVATARGSACVYAITTDDDTTMLSSWSTGDDRRLSALFTVRTGRETMLVQDAAARHVVAITVHDFGVDAVTLGATPPDLVVRPPRPRVAFPGADGAVDCDRPSGERNAAALALAGSWTGLTDAEVLKRARHLEQSESATAEELVELVFALRADDMSFARDKEADRLVRRLEARFPRHPEVRLLAARACVMSERWDDVRAAIADVDPATLDEARAQHVHHLRALVAYHEGRLDDLRTDVAAARSLEGRCDLDELADLAAPTSLADETTHDQQPLALLTAAIQHADACFAVSDLDGARRALDVPVVWSARERQSLARLAEAYLAMGPVTSRDRLRMIATLGTLLDEQDPSRARLRRDLRVRGAWDDRRIDEIASRARDWLDALDVSPTSPDSPA